MPAAVVHIGTQKTGSTAFQEALDRRTPELAGSGVRVLQYEGHLLPFSPRSQAFDLANLVVRTNADAYFRFVAPESYLDVVRDEGRASIRRQAAAPEPVLLASMESLSLVRTEDEVRALVGLLAPRSVRIVVSLRQRDDYLRSLRQQVHRLGLRSVSRYPDSCLYLARDSWLLDYDALVGTYASVVGAGNVTVVDYDDVTRRDGSVVPALWAACGLPATVLQADDDAWSNVTAQMDHAASGNRHRDADLYLTDDVDHLRDMAASARASTARLQATWSWQVTAPLRTAKWRAASWRRERA
jgi:hypothetical protein